jgi:hypothetical protein
MDHSITIPVYKQLSVGTQFGRLTTVSDVYRRELDNRLAIDVACSCGKTVYGLRIFNMIHGRQVSCGCFHREQTGKIKFSHGQAIKGAVSPEYVIWAQMVQRCTNPKHKNWNYYGGRGIAVCEQWINSFEEFFKHIGPRPGSSGREFQLDRINNDGNYEPGNVRWATVEIQLNNQRRPQRWTHGRCGHLLTFIWGKNRCLTCLREKKVT